MDQNQEFGPAYSSEEAPRTSSNNMLIYNIKYVPLSEQEQSEVEVLFDVN